MNQTKTVLLEYDRFSSSLSIYRLSERDRKNPILAAFLRKNTTSELSAEPISLEVNEKRLHSTYQFLQKILKRLNLELELGTEVSHELASIKASEDQFKEFAAKAKRIWNGEVESKEFSNFIDVLAKKCPGRIFYHKQLLSAFHLAFSQNACNFSVPGAGKTSVVYAAYSYLKSLDKNHPKSVQKLLVVGPLASFKAWEDEYHAIFQKKPISFRLSGAVSYSDRQSFLRGSSKKSSSTELILTSYPTMSNLEDLFLNFLRNSSDKAMIVLDEAHYIKREDGIWSSSILRLAKEGASRVILTGTPAPNGYEDLSNLFQFIYPEKNIVGFPISTLRAMSSNSMENAVSELKERIKPFYTRIKKSDLNLPEVNFHRIQVPLSKNHREIYSMVERRMIPALRSSFSAQNNIRIRARLIRLRQAACNPELLLKPLSEDALFFKDELNFLTETEHHLSDLIQDFSVSRDLLRLNVCEELVDKIIEKQKKVLIWSYSLGNVELLKLRLNGKAKFLEVLTGSVPVSEQDEGEYDAGSREDIIDQFHDQKGSAILIANPQAVGESISLHKACRSAIYFDRDFNAGRFIQSKDRIHRFNPKAGLPVTYYYLNGINTVDEDIDSRLTDKEKRLSDLVDSEEIPLFLALDDESDRLDLKTIVESYERRKTH